jgi:hypothetical protein
VARAIEDILGDNTCAQRRADYASRIDSADAIARACGLIEGLVPGKYDHLFRGTRRAAK